LSKLVDGCTYPSKIAREIPIQRGSAQQRGYIIFGHKGAARAFNRNQVCDRAPIDGYTHAYSSFNLAQHPAYPVAKLALWNGLHDL